MMSFLWFGKKKKEFPDLPKMPDLGEAKLPHLPKKSFHSFPEYGKEPMVPVDLGEADIPKRSPAPIMPKVSFDEEFSMPKINPNMPVERSIAPIERPIERREGHIYVELDQYKEAIAKVDRVKEKIKQAEDVLDELNKLKLEEEKEIEAWRRYLQDVKNNLLDVDKKLFEP
tara:strand:+ start:5345 stop:5857 length:513 start_codon:yes stop_codon:yes gene_type:complete